MCITLLCLFPGKAGTPAQASAHAERVYRDVSPEVSVTIYRAYLEHVYPWTVQERALLRTVRITALLPGSPQCREVVEHWTTRTPPFWVTVCLGKRYGFTYSE